MKHFLTNDYSEKTVDISLKNIYSVYIQFFPEYDTQKNQDKITSSAKTANPEKVHFLKIYLALHRLNLQLKRRLQNRIL